MTTNYQELAEKNGLGQDRAERSTWSNNWALMGVPQFARICEMVFGGQVSILPNAEIFKAARRLAGSGKKRGNITISVVADDDLTTTYKVGEEVFQLDAEDGAVIA